MSNVIDVDLQQRVDAVADARGVPVATVLREALTTFLDREEARAALARDARAALAAYKADGLHHVATRAAAAISAKLRVLETRPHKGASSSRS